MANSSPVAYRQPDLRQHVERPGREPRQHPVAEGAGDHRGQQDDRQAGVGGQLGRRTDPARAVVLAVGRRRSATSMQVVHGAGRRLGARLRGADRQEAVGVRPEPQGLGLAEDAQRGDQHAGHLRERRLHRQRPGSGARRRRRPPLRDRRHQARRHHRDRARSGTTTRSAARSRPAAITTACSTIADFSGFLHASTPRPASRTGRTTCSPPSGARRW